MGIMNTLLRAVTWWNGSTLGTQLFTMRKGTKVGEDDAGNIFYRNADDSKRWVIFNGEVEASRISPDWHGWLHYTYEQPPTEAPLPRKVWETEHKPNLTGTIHAYRPQGSLAETGQRAKTTGDYEAWRPDA